MKCFLTFSLLLTLFSIAIGQPVINRNQIMNPGDVVSVAEVLSLPDGPGLAGADVTWDFSDVEMDSASLVRVYFASPDTTPYFNEFPTSDLVQIVGFETFKAYQYMNTSSDLIEVVGNVIPGFTVGVATYSNPATLLEFPLTYETQWTDDFEYELNFQGLTTYLSEGDTKGVVDGYGTLVLPQGTFDDVIRVKEISFTTDTASLGFGIYERSYIYDTLYFWLSPTQPGPLGSYNRNYERSVYSLISGDTVMVEEEIETSETFSFDPMAEPTSASNDITIGEFGMQVSPNPFGSILDLSFRMDNPDTMEFSLQSVDGTSVFRHALTAQAGENAFRISLPEITPGIYVAVLRSSSGGDVQKLIGIGGSR